MDHHKVRRKYRSVVVESDVVTQIDQVGTHGTAEIRGSLCGLESGFMSRAIQKFSARSLQGIERLCFGRHEPATIIFACPLMYSKGVIDGDGTGALDKWPVVGTS